MNNLAHHRQLFNLRDNPQPDKTSETSSFRTIAAINVQRGDGDIIATCDLKVGGLLIRGVRVRRGRQGTTYVNFPRRHVNGQWVDIIEITSTPVGDACRQVVLNAAAEVNR